MGRLAPIIRLPMRWAPVGPGCCPYCTPNWMSGQISRCASCAAASAQLAQREIWPDIQLGVQYGQQPGPTGAQRMGSLMIGASLPIYTKNRQLQLREEANAMSAMAAADLVAM